MSDELNGAPTTERNGRVPTGARRVLIFGFYDGALDGVLEADTGEIFRFEPLAEPEGPLHQRYRSFTLRALPTDALDRLVMLIEPHIPARWPAWMPVWNFSDEATRSSVETGTDAILEQAGDVTWQITTDDYHSFAHFDAVPVQPAPAARD
ncbi:MAG TPA: hypothetical protein VKD90_29825 [Gemmataceae bacterium]|nr:hypothetical protein [Gemmataceae bacterium]